MHQLSKIGNNYLLEPFHEYIYGESLSGATQISIEPKVLASDFIERYKNWKGIDRSTVFRYLQ